MFWSPVRRIESCFGDVASKGRRVLRLNRPLRSVVPQAVGGNKEYVGEGDVDDSALPADMKVEWVRVYQTPEQSRDNPT